MDGKEQEEQVKGAGAEFVVYGCWLLWWPRQGVLSYGSSGRVWAFSERKDEILEQSTYKSTYTLTCNLTTRADLTAGMAL